MLYKFLIENREKILVIVEQKTVAISENRPTNGKTRRSVDAFYEHLIHELRRESRGLPQSSEDSAARKHGKLATVLHGKELSRLGYTVSQVVHGYGVLCQAVTHLAMSQKFVISASEFGVLNLSLDIAIADAVTAFTAEGSHAGADSAKKMGFLVHELRNALAAAIIAHAMVKKGVVGTGGSTNALLERNLNRMRDLLDRSFAEARMHNEKAAEHEPVALRKIIEEVEATANEEARLKGLRIVVQSERELEVVGDRNYLISALSNLVQNAIKYSKKGGTIEVRSLEKGDHAVLEVEDECGGLPKGRAEELFKAYTQKSKDKSGLGLGLTISRRAVALNGGKLAVRDLPGKGCIFSITLPKRKILRAAAKHATVH